MDADEVVVLVFAALDRCFLEPIVLVVEKRCDGTAFGFCKKKLEERPFAKDGAVRCPVTLIREGALVLHVVTQGTDHV